MSVDQSNKNSRPRVGLSAEDVQALLTNPAPAQRAKVVSQLGVDIDSGRLSRAEWEMALEIMRAMAADAEQFSDGKGFEDDVCLVAAEVVRLPES